MATAAKMLLATAILLFVGPARSGEPEASTALPEAAPPDAPQRSSMESEDFGNPAPAGSPESLLDSFPTIPVGDYDLLRLRITSRRRDFAVRLRAATTDSARQGIIVEAGGYLAKSLVDSLIPFWYGTHWAFEGHTEKPGVGTIACGYFVSTTLQHAGFQVNRYKLAQQSPRNEAVSLELSDSIQEFQGIAPSDLKKRLDPLEDGLYFIGLDNHVGYLVKRQGELFFIHSNYVFRLGVMVELAETSKAIPSGRYLIARLSTNARLVEKWIRGERIYIRQK